MFDTHVKIVVAIGNSEYRAVMGEQFEVEGIQLVIHRKVKSRFICYGYAISDPKSGFMIASGGSKAKAFADLKRRFDEVGVAQICVMLARCPSAPKDVAEVFKKGKLTNVNAELVQAMVDKIQKEVELTDDEVQIVRSLLVKTGDYTGMLVAKPPLRCYPLKSAAWNALMPSSKRQVAVEYTCEQAKELYKKLARLKSPTVLDRGSFKNLMAA